LPGCPGAAEERPEKRTGTASYASGFCFAGLLGMNRERKESVSSSGSNNIFFPSIMNGRGGQRLERFGDWVIILVAAGIMFGWILRRFDRWLHEPPGSRLRKLAFAGGGEAELEQDDTVLLLQEHGYKALSGKHRIPLGVVLDEGPVKNTYPYFDYLVSKEDKYYLVKMERAGQPMDWTTNGLRDKLLLFVLLFPDCDGIIIVESESQQLRTVRFKVGDGDS
jgi:hypothetical protein